MQGLRKIAGGTARSQARKLVPHGRRGLLRRSLACRYMLGKLMIKPQLDRELRAHGLAQQIVRQQILRLRRLDGGP